MSLLQFATRVTGPIDAAICGAVNLAFPLYFLPWDSTLSWFGLPSLFAFLAPMAFFTAFFPSYFGMGNGVAQRMLGISPGPLEIPVAWRMRAIRRGFILGFTSLFALTLILAGLATIWPDMEIPAPWVVGLDGVGAAALGYGFQVAGVLAARRL